MNLIQRATNISLTPKSEWDVIAAEPASTGDLYRSYIAPLAAIGPVASLIGLTMFGIGIPFLGNYRVSFGAGLTHALTQYALGLVSIYVIALIINALAPTFGGEKNQMQALKVTAYAYTPAWIAGVLHLVPWAGLLTLLLSLYSLYVLYLGLPVLMKAPKEKAAGYTAVSVLCAVVLALVVGAITPGLGTSGMRMAGSSSTAGEGNEMLGHLKKMGDKMDVAKKKMEAAEKSGDAQAQMTAATEAMGAVMGGDGTVDVVDQGRLKALLPDSLPGLARSDVTAEKSAMGEFKISMAGAKYGDNGADRQVDIKITDMGNNKLFGTMFAWGMVEQDRETESGYEKTGKVDGRPTHEQLSKDRSDGEYSVLVGNRFMIEARGRNVDMPVLKQAAAAVGFGKLEAMKNEGVKQ